MLFYLLKHMAKPQTATRETKMLSEDCKKHKKTKNTASHSTNLQIDCKLL